MRIREVFSGIVCVFMLAVIGCRKISAAPINPVFQVKSGGVLRDYSVHLPQKKSTGPVPTVIMLHGGGGNADGSAKNTLWDRLSDKEGFLVVYPQGIGKELHGKPLGTWNSGNCCGMAMEENIDDIGFISVLIDELSRKFNADKSRIYITGISNGAQMSYRLACELSEKITAIAPVAGNAVRCREKPSRPVPIMHIHGKLDPCIPLEGGKCGGCFERFMRGLGIPARDRFWECEGIESYVRYRAELNGCSQEHKVTYQSGFSECKTYNCPANAEVTLCLNSDGGHSFPGGTEGIDACETKPTGYVCKLWQKTVGPISNFDGKGRIWDFFKRYRSTAK